MNHSCKQNINILAIFNYVQFSFKAQEFLYHVFLCNYLIVNFVLQSLSSGNARMVNGIGPIILRWFIRAKHSVPNTHRRIVWHVMAGYLIFHIVHKSYKLQMVSKDSSETMNVQFYFLSWIALEVTNQYRNWLLFYNTFQQ